VPAILVSSPQPTVDRLQSLPQSSTTAALHCTVTVVGRARSGPVASRARAQEYVFPLDRNASGIANFDYWGRAQAHRHGWHPPAPADVEYSEHPDSF
jgi:hypothetical protein